MCKSRTLAKCLSLKNAVTIVIRLVSACTAPPKSTFVRNVQLVSESDTTNTNSTIAVGHEYSLFTLTASQAPPIVIPVKKNDKQIQMELDTGAAGSLVSEGTYKLHWPEQQL